MNQRRIVSLALSALLLTTCEQDPGFNYDNIPGLYKGSLYYFTADGPDKVGVNVPNMSKTDTYRTTVTLDGDAYVMAFDEAFKYKVPDTRVEVFSITNGNTAGIRTTSGQTYSSSNAMNSFPGQPSNYFSDETHVRRVRCELTLKSNDPDSAYFLNFVLFREY
jgi:hypothetical protein